MNEDMTKALAAVAIASALNSCVELSVDSDGRAFKLAAALVAAAGHGGVIRTVSKDFTEDSAYPSIRYYGYRLKRGKHYVDIAVPDRSTRWAKDKSKEGLRPILVCNSWWTWEFAVDLISTYLAGKENE